MKIIPIFIMLIMSLLACKSTYLSSANLEQAKTEVRQAEKDFNDLAAKEGIAIAFYTFAAADAVINRGGKIIQGKEAIKVFYDKDSYKTAKLTWAPDFVEVSKSSDLAYTYGKFTFSGTGADGKVVSSEGIFHTVWKRQQDGKWRFVYD